MKIHIKTTLILALGQAYILHSTPPEIKSKTPLAAVVMGNQNNTCLEKKNIDQKKTYTSNTSPLEVCCLFSLPLFTGIAMRILQSREKQA